VVVVAVVPQAVLLLVRRVRDPERREAEVEEGLTAGEAQLSQQLASPV
jgi:hypothetical protein